MEVIDPDEDVTDMECGDLLAMVVGFLEEGRIEGDTTNVTFYSVE